MEINCVRLFGEGMGNGVLTILFNDLPSPKP